MLGFPFARLTPWPEIGYQYVKQGAEALSWKFCKDGCAFDRGSQKSRLLAA